MSNFGTGQGLFGSNQNKNQGTSTPGSTPAAGTSAFGSLGLNTTSGSPFGGTGTGNTLGGGGTTSAPTGSLFGSGGGAFGSGGNTNTSTSTPSGTGTGGTGSLFGGSSLFAGVYASYSAFMKPPHASTTQEILRQIQGLRRQRRVGCSQIRVRTQAPRGRRQDKAYLALPPAQVRGAGLEVRTN